MRRQARISGGGTLVVRSASALQVWLWLLIFIFQNEFRISRSIQPGYLDFDNLPETNFTCTGKVIGGYYADLETSCQMFHVCTVGQQDEPMDIKFLCLNGTVFDQETRVCERVDEVDCTKSEKFYSLNLELYGSTAPPIIQPDQTKPQTTEQNAQQGKPNHEDTDPSIDESPTTFHDKTHEHSTDMLDSTDDPTQEINKDKPKITQTNYGHPSYPFHEDIEYQDEDTESESPDYEEEYHAPSTTTFHVPTTTTTTTTTSTTTTTTTTTQPPTSTTIIPSLTSTLHLSPIPHLGSAPSPTISSVSPSTGSSSVQSSPSLPNLDPALLSPQEFIYHHRGPGPEAISFQRHGLRPADGVYITHAPPQQFDHFQYEFSRTAPRLTQARPSPFVQRPQPTPFRATTLDPRDQLLRPGQTSQPSERHETSVKHRPQTYGTALPAQRPLPFNPYYYDRKRSDDFPTEIESSLSARSVAPPTVTERPPVKPKSPPRVIVTASASVSDSNGKRLNYTVGNVVSAVKPIVPINYDDYKESDLIFDPFFLDVPKLQKRRKTRSNKNKKVVTIPSTATLSSEIVTGKNTITFSPITSRATTTNRLSTTSLPSTTTYISSAAGDNAAAINRDGTTKRGIKTKKRVKTTSSTSTTTVAWNPNDYVDDNYEPQAYMPHAPPLAVLVAYDHNKYNQEKQSKYKLDEEKTPRDLKSNVNHLEQSTSTSSAVQKTSSQIEGAGLVAGSMPTAASPVPPPPPPVEALSCATALSTDCRTRA